MASFSRSIELKSIKMWMVPAGAALLVVCLLDISGLLQFIVGFIPSDLEKNAFGGSNTIRDWLEVLYFCSSVGVLIIAWGALIFAGKQAQEAEITRKREYYLHIQDVWRSSDLEKSKDFVNECRTSFKTRTGPAISIGDHCALKLAEDRSKSAASYRSHMQILAYFEHIGVLIRMDYIDSDYVYYLFRGVLLEVNVIYGSFINDRIKEIEATGDTESARKFYEHTRWLIAHIRDYKPVPLKA